MRLQRGDKFSMAGESNLMQQLESSSCGIRDF